MKKVIKSIVIFTIIVISQFGYSQQKKEDEMTLKRIYDLARRYEQLAQYSRSLELYYQLWNKDLMNPNYYRGVKRNLINLKKFDEALDVVNKMIENQGSVSNKADLGDVYFKIGKKEQAFDVWNEIIKSNSKDRSCYQIVASSMIGNGLYDEAISLYNLARKNFNDEKLFLIETANLYRIKMDFKNAVLLYIEYLKSNPGQYSYIEYNITSIASSPEAIEIVENILIEKIKNEKDEIGLRNLLAALYMRTSNYQSALNEFSLIDEYLESRLNNDQKKLGSELYKFAQNAFNDNAYKYAIQAYTLLISRYPNSPYATNSLFGIGMSYQLSGDFQKAISSYEKLIHSYKSSPFVNNSYFQIGEIQLEFYNNPNEAKKYYMMAMEDKPIKQINYDAMLRIGDCFIRSDLLNEAKKWLEDIQKKYPTSEIRRQSDFKIGQIEFWQGNFDASLSAFEKIYKSPVTRLDDNSNNYINDALEYSLFITENKENVKLFKLYAQARLLLEQKKNEQALKILHELIELDSTGQLLDEALLLIGQEEYRLGEYRQAIESFKKIVDIYPKSVHCDLALKMIGEIYDFGLNDKVNAKINYELVLTNYPYSVYLEDVRDRIRKLDDIQQKESIIN